jgi:hypothetical protein
VTICPCCGFKSANSGSGVYSVDCAGCGAHSVGEPLPRPANELPAYGRSLLLSVIGTLAVLVFAVETIITLAGRATLSFGFWSWVAAGETAAWRLKWAAIPLTLLVFFGSRRVYRSIRQAPASFCGLRAARNGYFASAAVPLLILVLIGVTVPARLRHRQWGIEAADNAQGYATARVLLQYRDKFGTFPSDKKDLAQLPDPDGSIAALLKDLEGAEYKPSAEVAAVPTQHPRTLRGAVIRNASLTIPDESLTEALSVTNYEMRLPGADKLLNTDDDLIIRDGLVGKASETPRRGNVGKSATAQKTR